MFQPKTILNTADVSIVPNDWPQWRDLTAADLSMKRRNVVVDGWRIMQREAMKGVEFVYWADEPILLKGADGGIPSRVLLPPTPPGSRWLQDERIAERREAGGRRSGVHRGI